jgi:hypothetical protein
VAKLARDLIKMPKYKGNEAETLYVMGSFIDLWYEPFAHAIETFEQAHRSGLRAGNHAFGYGACHESISASFIAGQPLGEIANKFLKVSLKLRQYNLVSIQRVLDPVGILTFHLMGRKAGGVDGIDGTSTDWEEMEKLEDLRDDSSNHLTLTWQCFTRMILAYYLDEFEVADGISKKFNNTVTGESYTFISIGSFFSGLINIAMYRKTGRRKYKRRAQIYTNKVGDTVKACCNNNAHKYHLMQAECMGAFRTHGQGAIKQKYDRAIAEAAEMGCLHDQALANELAGEYFLRRKESLWCKDYFGRACLLYREWGAKNKVNILMQKRGEYIKKSQWSTALSSSTRKVISEQAAQLLDETYPEHSITAEMDDLASENVSALTPIGEHSTYNCSKNRWENTESQCQTSPPRAPPRRPLRD